jgi:hypothetical protein
MCEGGERFEYVFGIHDSTILEMSKPSKVFEKTSDA